MRSQLQRYTYWLRSIWSRTAFAAFCAAILLPCGAWAESSARWLLIVDTSLSMRTRAKNTEIVVHDLLANGMNGQMARGDSLGVWTFNNELHTGEAPLQIWSPEDARTIADRTTQFVANRKYEKSTEIDKMLKEMFGVVEASDLITAIIISDADDEIKGTPFDAKINEVFKQNSRQQKKFKMPFVTVLRGERGKFTACMVNMAQFPIEIPPIKREVPKPPQPKPVAKPAPTLPPLIISGKKPEPVVAPQPVPMTSVAPPPATVAPVTPSPTPVAQLTPPQQQISAVTPQFLATPAEINKAETPPIPTTSLPPQPTPVKTDLAPPTPDSHSAKPAANQAVATPQATAPAEMVQKAPAVSEKAKPSSQAPAPETAVAVAPQGFFSQRNILIVLIAIAVMLAAIVFLLMRRPRASHTSLITSSLDREKK